MILWLTGVATEFGLITFDSGVDGECLPVALKGPPEIILTWRASQMALKDLPPDRTRLGKGLHALG
jgi:hypothetical protein